MSTKYPRNDPVYAVWGDYLEEQDRKKKRERLANWCGFCAAFFVGFVWMKAWSGFPTIQAGFGAVPVLIAFAVTHRAVKSD